MAFALWHSESGKLTELALEGLSRLRNHTHLKPLAVLGDAVYGCQEIVEWLKDYNWPCIARFKKNQNLYRQAVTFCIPTGCKTMRAWISLKFKCSAGSGLFLDCKIKATLTEVAGWIISTMGRL